ncbi:hypothetical protein J8H85_08375 [Mariniflexile gromovii]|uniref:Glycoside hydrolase family 31 TIM barrel domain-containing protein n=1 Tax=Mariniflexile gromovii TaxID=362523 RepID=A0ABS4BTC5_9FLAO|nr:hypothetical protein [Mariniflexile gromovii]
MMYEGRREEFPNERVFNLTRSAYAGQQRYGATVSDWNGSYCDNPDCLMKADGNGYWDIIIIIIIIIIENEGTYDIELFSLV